MEGDAVEGPVDYVSRDEVVQELNEVKSGKAPGPSDISFYLIELECMNSSDGSCKVM